MINADMRIYDYYTYGEQDSYGQPKLTETAQGTVKMAIYITSQSIQGNVNYKDCGYMGLTCGEVNDSYVIQYGNEKLKVLYVNPQGRFKQVFMQQL